MSWKRSFSDGTEIVVSTSSNDGVPNANIVISLGFMNDKLLAADCQMHTTINNLKMNKNVCVISGYYRIRGVVELITSGPVFEMCAEKSHGYTVRHAILITVKEVSDLNEVRKIV